jgi:hypothetical protein
MVASGVSRVKHLAVSDQLSAFRFGVQTEGRSQSDRVTAQRMVPKADC